MLTPTPMVPMVIIDNDNKEKNKTWGVRHSPCLILYLMHVKTMHLP